jgi:hypothetical protein
LDNRPLRVGDVTSGIIGSAGPETASKNVGDGISAWPFPGIDADFKRGDAGNANRTNDHCVAQDGLDSNGPGSAYVDEINTSGPCPAGQPKQRRSLLINLLVWKSRPDGGNAA